MDEFEDYHSPNYHKYNTGNRLYEYHLEQMLKRTYEMVAEVKPATLLDAGCGEGFVTEYIAERDPELEITGVDVSEKAIRYANAHFGELADFQTDNLYDLSFEDDSFDTVLCSEVLEHLDEPERAAMELSRVAREYVVITVPREPYFKWLNDIGRFLGLSPDPGHVNFWTKSSFKKFIYQRYGNGEFATRHLWQLARSRVPGS